MAGDLPKPRNLAAELVDRGDGWHVSPELMTEGRERCLSTTHVGGVCGPYCVGLAEASGNPPVFDADGNLHDQGDAPEWRPEFRAAGDLPEGQQSKELIEIIRVGAAAIPYDLISTPAVGVGDARRFRLAEAVVPAVVAAIEARVRADVAEEIARAIERDDMAMYAWEAARIARGLAVAPTESVVGALPEPAGARRPVLVLNDAQEAADEMIAQEKGDTND